MFAMRELPPHSPVEVHVSVRLKADCSGSGRTVLNSSNANRSIGVSSSSSNTIVVCAATAPTELTVAVCRRVPLLPCSFAPSPPHPHLQLLRQQHRCVGADMWQRQLYMSTGVRF
jgi:hypothetical protein